MPEPLPAALDKALDKGDVKTVGSILEGLSPAERRALAPAALKLGKALFLAKEGPELAQATFALLTATPAELRKTLTCRIVPEPALLEALERVKPEWLEEGAELLVSLTPVNFELARALVRRGLSRRPTHENYILGLLEDTRFHAHPFERDPGLLEWEVWRLFEVEGGGEASLAARDKYTQRSHSWTEAFLRQLQAGLLSRERVLDATLDALTRDFAPFRAGWFSRFHAELAPTLPELQARQERYVRLLHSAVPLCRASSTGSSPGNSVGAGRGALSSRVPTVSSARLTVAGTALCSRRR